MVFIQQCRKLLVVAVVLTAVIVTINATSLQVGSRQPRDGLICSQDINIRAQPGRIVNAQKTCNVPRWNQNITQIVATDLGRPGRGGYAQITKGGVGQKNVTLYLWSQKSQPLNFTIQVFAKL